MRQGGERFKDDPMPVDEDDVIDGGDIGARHEDASGRDDDDDARILSELPPHWAVFTERRR